MFLTPAPRPASPLRRGFTLIELIVVIVILGLLAGIGAVSYKAVIDRSQHAALTATGQQFLKEARALAAGEQGNPADVVAAAAADLPDGWTHTQGATSRSKVRLSRPDGAWVCVALPTDYSGTGQVTATGLSGAPAADTCPDTAGGPVGEPTGTPTTGSPTVTSPPVAAMVAAPENVKVVRSGDEALVTWSPVTQADAYQVRRDGSQLGQVTTTSYTDRTAVRTRTFSYAVATISGGISSPLSAPITAVPLPAQWSTLSAGWQNTAAVTDDGKLYTWGDDTYGQLGDGGTNTAATTPVQIRPDLTWASVEVGRTHMVAITTEGKLYTWGYDGNGQLGDGGAAVNQVEPVAIRPDLTWKSASAGYLHTVALTADGRMFTWGSDAHGQIGDGALAVYPSTPTEIMAGTTWASVAAGELHNVAITSEGHLYTWGFDANGQLGDGAEGAWMRDTPARIGWSTWKSASAGYYHTAALTASGQLYTWGMNTDGQLGNGSTTLAHSPEHISPGTTWSSVSVGDDSTGAIRADGALFAWGSDGNGQLGNGVANQGSLTPARVGSATNWKATALGGRHMVALDDTGRVSAWGWDNFGQLGDGGQSTYEPSPVPVNLP